MTNSLSYTFKMTFLYNLRKKSLLGETRAIIGVSNIML